jgi:hypothetical protein
MRLSKMIYLHFWSFVIISFNTFGDDDCIPLNPVLQNDDVCFNNVYAGARGLLTVACNQHCRH